MKYQFWKWTAALGAMGVLGLVTYRWWTKPRVLVSANPVNDVLTRMRIAVAAVTPLPDLIKISLNEGVVTVRGRVLRSEHRSVLAALYAEPEVHNLVDRLEIQDSLIGAARRILLSASSKPETVH